ncbi:MAG: metallophosphoesterase family protein, partial [Vallitaleaceae bacterium]|nr:metallophosphoesterase family protein [Vallitaleaceae bacterium]
MKYALISDLHGNGAALTAALQELEKEKMDQYIFLGDYFGDLPDGDEIVEQIRRFSNAYVIRGNKEDYLRELHHSDEKEWIHAQFQSLYWNYRQMDSKNRDYLIGLPEMISVPCPNSTKTIRIVHTIRDLFKGTVMDEISSSNYYLWLKEGLITKETFLTYVQKLLCEDQEFRRILQTIPEDLIVFGHTHVQWHIAIDGKVLVDAGSLGLPLDHDQAGALTLIEVIGEEILVEERRIAYSVQDYITQFKKSDLFEAAPHWSRIKVMELERASDEVAFLFSHIREIMKKSND